jgi:hypothetical protein
MEPELGSYCEVSSISFCPELIMRVNGFIFSLRNTFQKSQLDPLPHTISIDEKRPSIAKSGACFDGVNVHIYTKGPSYITPEI